MAAAWNDRRWHESLVLAADYREEAACIRDNVFPIDHVTGLGRAVGSEVNCHLVRCQIDRRLRGCDDVTRVRLSKTRCSGNLHPRPSVAPLAQRQTSDRSAFKTVALGGIQSAK